jgi:outer membrane lipoprotein LolB
MFRVSGFGFRVGLLGALLGGCAAAPSVPEQIEPSLPSQVQTHPENFQITGRVAVHYDGHAFSGGLRWRHTAGADEMLLSSPLGQGVAQIVRDESGVTLVNAADQQTYHAQDAEALTESVLGWRLPLAGMAYWVRGSPSPGAHQERSEAGQLVRLEQDGWQIDYSGQSQVNGEAMPRKIFMQRGDLEIRVVIDEWGAQ